MTTRCTHAASQGPDHVAARAESDACVRAHSLHRLKPYPMGKTGKTGRTGRTGRTSRSGRTGWTLIETLVVLLLIGLLMSIAWPSYRQHVRKAHRSEAIQALSQLQVAQERFRSRHPRYAAQLDELSVAALTPSRRYRLQILRSSASGFVLEALAVQEQTSDHECQRFRLALDAGLLQREALDGVGSDRTSLCWPH